jgi:hypothetical protein
LNGIATGPDDSTLSGLYNTHRFSADSSVDYYWLISNDPRTAAGAAVGTPQNADFDTYGFRYLRKLGDNWDMKWEHAIQSGEVGGLDLDAWATAFQLGYTKGGNQKVRYEFEYDLSPGDPGNFGKTETFQNLIPTNHKFYGIADLMAWKNMNAFRISRIWSPTPKTNWRVDYWRFKLDDVRDSWYNSVSAVLRGPAAVGTSDDIGSELDIRFTVKDKSVKHQFGLAKFFAGDYVKQTGAGGIVGDDSEFAYYMAIFPF